MDLRRNLREVHIFYLEDGDDMFLRNIGSQKDDTASYPRKWHSSKYPKFLVLSCDLMTPKH
jgi:hypothetical protein